MGFMVVMVTMVTCKQITHGPLSSNFKPNTGYMYIQYLFLSENFLLGIFKCLSGGDQINSYLYVYRNIYTD